MQVFAFEPMNANLRLLLNNIKANRWDAKAVGLSDGADSSERSRCA